MAVGDVDNDGLFDLYVTHFFNEHKTLWRQGPRRGVFPDHTSAAGFVKLWGLPLRTWARAHGARGR